MLVYCRQFGLAVLTDRCRVAPSTINIALRRSAPLCCALDYKHCTPDGVRRYVALLDYKHCTPDGVRRYVALLDYKHCTPDGVRRYVALLDYKHCTPDGVRCCVAPSTINMAPLTEYDGSLRYRLRV